MNRLEEIALSKYSIKVSLAQAELISLALDIYSRMESGQLEWIFSMISWKYYENLETAEPLIKDLKKLLTGMQKGNLGIGNVSEKAKMAFDLHQVIRHRLSWDENPDGGVAVHFNKPMQWSGEPLAKIDRLKNNQ